MLGRNNYLGFHAVWPGITAEQEATWENTRVFRDAGQAVATLRAEPGRDIVVLNSATLIQSMLAAGLVDDLRLAVVPVLLGGGLRLLPDGVSSRPPAGRRVQSPSAGPQRKPWPPHQPADRIPLNGHLDSPQ